MAQQDFAFHIRVEPHPLRNGGNDLCRPLLQHRWGSIRRHLGRREERGVFGPQLAVEYLVAPLAVRQERQGMRQHIRLILRIWQTGHDRPWRWTVKRLGDDGSCRCVPDLAAGDQQRIGEETALGGGHIQQAFKPAQDFRRAVGYVILRLPGASQRDVGRQPGRKTAPEIIGAAAAV